MVQLGDMQDSGERSQGTAGGCTKGHEAQCRYATSPRAQCECKCGGDNHGGGLMNNETLDAFLDMFGYEPMDLSNPEQYGGEVKLVLRALKDLSTFCIAPKPGCQHARETNFGDQFTIGIDAAVIGLKGHSGGVKDKNGTGWWIVVICPDCEYQAAWHKIMNKHRLDPTDYTDEKVNQ